MPSARKLKVGLVFDDTLDSSDGVAQYVKTLGRWLAEQGHEVRYLVGQTKLTEWSGGKVYSLARNYRVRFNGNWLSIPGPANNREIKKILADEDFDVLHVQVPYSPLLAAQVINTASKKTAIVGTFHIFPAGWLSQGGSRILRLALLRSKRRFDQFFSVSEAAAKFARRAYGISSIVIPNAIDSKLFKNTGQKEQSGIVFLGRLVERKGSKELLAAFKLLHESMPDVKLTIAGAGPLEEKLKKYVSDNNLNKAVKFAGFVSEQEKARLLAGARIACFPSLYGESFGIVLIEAMAAGAGVVLGGDNPGYRSVLSGQDMLLFDPKDTEEFASRLELLLKDEKLAKQIHDWQQLAVKRFDINVVGSELVRNYLEQIDIKNKSEHNKRK